MSSVVCLERRRVADAQVVDDDVRRAAELVEGVRGRLLDAVRGGEIGGDDPAPLSRFLTQHLGVAVRNDDLGALGGQQIGDGLTDSVCAGADVGELALQLIIHARSCYLAVRNSVASLSTTGVGVGPS